jgi:hypothetical protein
MANTVTNPGKRLAGLIADLGHKLAGKKISEEELALFLKRQNPFRKTTLATAVAATFLTENYFVRRPGLEVSKYFVSWITSAYPNPLVSRGLDGVESFDLTKASYDREIIARPEMGGEENVRKYALTPDQVAALIDLQPEGVAGKLLTNNRSNLFYVVGVNGVLFVVGVCWSPLCRWYVRTWELGEVGSWNAGYRVFRNTQV